MKIVVAMDSFKESISSGELNKIISQSISEVNPNIEIYTQIVSDGGEGTVDTFCEIGYEKINVKVTGPYFEEVDAYYAYDSSNKRAVIEMALASGIERVPEENKKTINATTFGTGELILDAVNRGCTDIIIGIGSSATTDCGIGMAGALGVKFLDKNNNEVKLVGGELININEIDSTNLVDLSNVNIKVASDVSNVLFGVNGAAYVYAKQKGASEEEIKLLDDGLININELFKKEGYDFSKIEGSGAAGGLGAALIYFCNASLEPGFKLISEAVNLEQLIKDSDYVITGEGKFDSQTLNGKVPVALSLLSKKYNNKVIGIFGIIDDPQIANDFKYFDALFSTTSKLDTLDNTFKSTSANLRLIAKSIANLIS